MRILVELEGVLRQNDQPMPDGVKLVGALKSINEIIILGSKSLEYETRWLAETRILPLADEVLGDNAGLPGEELTHRQITLQRAQGNVDVILTANPTLASWAFDKGITALLFAHPNNVRPEWRPDAPKQVRAWGDIETSIKNRAVVESGYSLGSQWE
jgi:hypothetical protein